MRKILSLMICPLLLSLTLQSCLKEQDEVFEESASARMSNYLTRVSEVLVSADNGWVLNYFPDRNQSYGGYAYTLRFDGQNVEAKTQLDGGTDSFVSTYKLTNDDGPILSFDTYNDALHFFARPTASRYEAYDGDFEFVVMEVSDDQNTILLKGKRTGNLMQMIRLSTTPDDYLSAVAKVQAAMPFQAYEFEVNGTAVYVDGQEGNLVMTYVSGDGEQSVTAPYIFTPSGMEFYRAVNILGQEFYGLEYVERGEPQPKIGDSFRALGNEGIVFTSVPQKLNLQFVRGNWYVAASTLGDFATPYWNVVNRTLTQDYGEQLYYAFMGYANGGYGLQFSVTNGSEEFISALYYEYGLVGDDVVTLGFAGTGAGEAGWYYQYANFAYALFPFGYMNENGMTDPRTFRITADNMESPRQLTLTEDDNPDNVITLWAEPVYFPFEH
ncbi:MAG: DUF4302 domain-containing protein [Prevotella sp.]|nr:DUF4302 domain-containing protein [Prevotella sp.]